MNYSPPSKLPWTFLHGINNASRIWLPILASGTYTVGTICPTLEPLEHMDAIGDSIATLIQGPTILVGHSLGGYVALDILARHKHLVHGIVLINSSCLVDDPAMKSARRVLASRALGGEYKALVEGSTERVYHPDNLSSPELISQRKQDIAVYGAKCFAAHQIACTTRLDRTDELRAFAGPKLVIAASNDRVISFDAQQSMAEKTKARFVSIPDAGHMLPAEQPARLASVLNDWRYDVSVKLGNCKE